MTPADVPSSSSLDDARTLSADLAHAAGDTVDGVLLYGSHLLNATPDRHSAYDFVVLVTDYRTFYRSLKAAGEIHRPAWLLSSLARILPPNVIAFTPNDGQDGIAKCLIISRDHFARALGPCPRDHFLLGRMIQRVALVWARDEASGAWVNDRLEEARAGVLAWVGPYLDDEFDAESVGRRILAVCYSGEFRPEAGDRAEKIFEAQREHFVQQLTPVLEGAAAAGDLAPVGDEGAGAPTLARYRFVERPVAAVRRRWAWHFVRSKARVTARWPKHVLTFDNWLPYISRKVERRTGIKVELTRLERRLPLIFLWPKVIKVLRGRPDKERPS